MPRPRKCRKVCCLPDNDGFVPVRGGEELTPIVLNVDEYESIRLIDREGFSQEQCGEYMRIASTTVQQIYAAARKKLADALVEGLPLRIEGGDFTLCSGNSAAYGCKNCYQQKSHPMHEKPKGDNMRIAVTYENGEIFQHFGHTEQFKIYDVEDGKIISSEVVDAGGSVSVTLPFAGRTLRVRIENADGIEQKDYRVYSAALDGTALPVAEGILRIPRAEIEALTADAIHEITVILHA